MNDTSLGATGNRVTQNPPLKWQVGLLNTEGKFLTAESFGLKLNASATTLKKRQTWVIVSDPQNEVIYLKSHLNRFLSADKDGRVTCGNEKPGLNERYFVEYCPDGSGRWAFRSAQYGFHLTAEEDYISCFSRTAVWWSVRLAIHPQVHVKNLNRQRYLRLSDDEIHGDQKYAWGYDSMITLEHVHGKVAVTTRDRRYLRHDGTLVTGPPTPDELYNLEIRCGPASGMAFRDREGRYLTNIGSSGVMKSKNKTVGKDELFILENSYPQVAVYASNGKIASIRQGVDVYANQTTVESTEIFQLEHQSKSLKWRFRTCEGSVWTLSETSSGIKAAENEHTKNTLFDIVYHISGYLAIRAANQMYINARRLGAMAATNDNIGEQETFRLALLNRPLIVLRSEFGFLGSRGTRLECNLMVYEAFQLESKEPGLYHIKASNDQYWSVSRSGEMRLVRAESELVPFILQFFPRNQLAILAANGLYLRGEQNGFVSASSEEPLQNCLWDF